jgi:hypothetical protein
MFLLLSTMEATVRNYNTPPTSRARLREDLAVLWTVWEHRGNLVDMVGGGGG